MNRNIRIHYNLPGRLKGVKILSLKGTAILIANQKYKENKSLFDDLQKLRNVYRLKGFYIGFLYERSDVR
jgi:hypothetical protein